MEIEDMSRKSNNIKMIIPLLLVAVYSENIILANNHIVFVPLSQKFPLVDHTMTLLLQTEAPHFNFINSWFGIASPHNVIPTWNLTISQCNVQQTHTFYLLENVQCVCLCVRDLLLEISVWSQVSATTAMPEKAVVMIMSNGLAIKSAWGLDIIVEELSWQFRTKFK